MLSLALGETGMVKDDFCSRPLCHEVEFHNRINTWVPGHHSPCLDDSFARDELDVPPHNMAAEKREASAYFTADFRRRRAERHTGFHDPAKLGGLVELFGVGECFVHALAVRLENRFLMNRLRRVRNLLTRARPTAGRGDS